MAGEMAWVGKKPIKRLGGMADALALASDLGFQIPNQNHQEDMQNSGNALGLSEKNDSLTKLLRELTTVQRNLADLQVEMQGRQDDNSVAYLTHVSEMEKKRQKLAKTTAILKDVIQNKDRIIARLQQPYSLDCLPVEAEFQRQFSELLLKAASDYGALTTAITDFQWSQSFKSPPSVWAEMLRPIPVALASCTRYFEAVSAMRESMTTLHTVRVGSPSPVTTPQKTSQWASEHVETECTTPLQWNSNLNVQEANSVGPVMSRHKKINGLTAAEELDFDNSDATQSELANLSQRRLSWPPVNNTNA